MMIDISAFLPAVIMVAVMMLPILSAVVVLLWVRRAEARDERRSPLNDKLLHQPGSQARKRAEEIGDDIMTRASYLLLVGPLCMIVVLLPRVRWAHLHFEWVEYLAIALAIASILWALRDIIRFRRDRRNWLNGMRGEMASAQALDRLRAQGCEVFHDVPGERGNIDHVVVTPNGVFAVETKWRSKHGQGAASVEVWFDGKALQFPSYRDTAAIEQAKGCADDLRKFLKGRTGEQVLVTPVVALPGWFVKDRMEAKASGVLAINPKMGTMLLKQPGAALQASQRNRIVSAIVERYPEIDT
jgi:membrane protein implicated in regulation of membrane protease activity